MNINFRTPISEELATIFVAEFDRDDAAEQWAAYKANAFNPTQWQEAQRGLEVFRLGLRERQLVLQAFDARVPEWLPGDYVLKALQPLLRIVCPGQRAQRSVIEGLPALVCLAAIALAVAVLAEPYDALAPDKTAQKRSLLHEYR